jgi:translation initiation factor IF-2
VFISHKKKREAEDMAEEFALAKKASNVFSDDFAYTDDFVLPVIIKADTYGSLEAIEKEINNIKLEGVRHKIILKEVGSVMEKDIIMASIDKSVVVIAFHTAVDRKAQDAAMRHNVKIHSFDIIYKMSEWLTVYTEDAKPKTEVEEAAGALRIIRVFNRSKESQIVGGKVVSGIMKNHGIIRIIRKDIAIGKGKIQELQSYKQLVDEVQEGYECGLRIDSKYDIAEGDTLEYIVKKVV